MTESPDVSAWSSVRVDAPLGGGHRSQVWSGRTPDGPIVVRRSRRSPESLAWELALMDRLADLDFVVPTPVRTADGRRSDGPVVVQRWVPGAPPSTEADWRLVGTELQRLHDATGGSAQRPGCQRVFELGSDGRSVDADLSALSVENRAMVLGVFGALADVRTAVIHGDPCGDNIRIASDRTVGLIDWDESRVDVVWHDLSNLGVRILDPADHDRALLLSDAWEAANAWIVEPEYARSRLAALRARLDAVD